MIITCFLIIWPFVSIVCGIIDFSKIVKRQNPIFSICALNASDGGSAIFYFPGYKIERHCTIIGESSNINILCGGEIFWNFPWPYSEILKLENLKIDAH